MALPKLNEKLIGKVLKHIKAFPKSYEQDTISESCEKTKETPCGAIGCFGGWAILLSNPVAERAKLAAKETQLDEARELLGLTEDESNFLFDTTGNHDPKKDYKVIQRRLTHIRESRAVADRIAKLRNEIDKLGNKKLTHDAEEFPLFDYEEEL